MKNLSLPVKFALLVGGLLMLFAIYGAFSLTSLNSLGNTMNQLAGQNLALIRGSDQIHRLLLLQQIEFERGSRETSKAVQVESYGTLRIQASAKRFRELYGQLSQALEQTLAIVNAMPPGSGQQKISELLQALQAQLARYRANALKTYGWWQKLKLFQARKFNKEVSDANQNIDKLMAQIGATIKTHTDRQLQASQEQMARSKRLSVTILAVAMLAGALFAWWLSRSLTLPLGQVVAIATELANGDLDLSMEHDQRRDEIGRLQQAIATLVARLTQVIGQVSSSTQQLRGSADTLAHATTESTGLIQKQRNETDQIAAAIREINETTRHVASQTSNASIMANEADEAARTGQQRARETMLAVQTLADEVEHSGEAITRLDSQSREISNILNVIVTIAEQTNLLALNAAIEAARAGEHGRGFAVVADEVRQLAQNTQNATQEIEQMITQLQQGVKKAVSTMESSRNHSQFAVERATEGERALETVCEVIGRIRMINTSVSTATEQQSAATATVAGNLENILVIANQSNHATHEISTASDQLADLAEQLQNQVSYFRSKGQ